MTSNHLKKYIKSIVLQEISKQKRTKVRSLRESSNVGDIKSVSDLEDHKYQFISDSQEVASVLENIGIDPDEYDSVFAVIGDGDYEEVWGMSGIVPHLNKRVERLA